MASEGQTEKLEFYEGMWESVGYETRAREAAFEVLGSYIALSVHSACSSF